MKIGGSILFFHMMTNATLCRGCIEFLLMRNPSIQKGMGWRGKEGFTNTCAARKQVPEDSRRRRNTQGGIGGETRETEAPTTG